MRLTKSASGPTYIEQVQVAIEPRLDKGAFGGQHVAPLNTFCEETAHDVYRVTNRLQAVILGPEVSTMVN
jgi:hypothetical protein